MSLLKAVLFLAIFYAGQAYALESEGLAERDLTVKETVDSLSGTEKVEIGEVEKETEHDALSRKETHEGLHESHDSHESIRESVHESSDMANEHESGTGPREPIEHP
jgi:hypothetical protein